MRIDCATFEVRPVFEAEPTAWVCFTLYFHPQEWWVRMETLGVGATKAEARDDCIALLKAEGVTAPILDECRDPKDRRALISAAKTHCALHGLPIEALVSPLAGVALGNGDGVPR